MRKLLAKIIPFEVRYGLRRRLQDFPISRQFLQDISKQESALLDLKACKIPTDYITFTQKWMGVGSVQVPEEIDAAVDLMQSIDPKVACEIGTEHGGTNLLISQSLKKLQTMIAMDLFIRHKSHLMVFKCREMNLHFIDGSSHKGTTALRLNKYLDGKKIDILFIDGDHSYEGVKQDFAMYRTFVREGGLTFFHDIVPDHGVQLGIKTHAWTGGVPDLWKDLKGHYTHHEFVKDWKQNGMGIGALVYDPSIKLPEGY